MTDQHVTDYINLRKSQIERVISALEFEFNKIGFSGELIKDLAAVEYSLVKDDYSGEYSLQGVWYNPSGYKQGMLLFHPDGNFFAEYDVVKPHPKKDQWFVEAITAWGKDSVLNAEARLIAAVE